jgi:ureidoglycolate dehydrogenase (NAD+)
MTTKIASASKVTLDSLKAFCMEALTKTGFSQTDAQTVTDVLVTTDSFGVFTHGVRNLGLYIRRINCGGLSATAQPTIANEGLGWAIVDGHAAMGMVTSVYAMNIAIEKARATGIGYVSIRGGCHFGAAGYYALLAAKQDMIGLAMANDAPSMTVPGARGRVLGNNPFAYAVPAGKERPIFLDIACSTVSGLKVVDAAMKGIKTPLDWAVDKDGLPTSDQSGFLKPDGGCAIWPMSGHKGYGIALMVEALAAFASGAGIANHVGSWNGPEQTQPTNHGGAFIAINVGAMMPIKTFKERVDTTIREIHEAPKAKGSNRIFVPGEMEWQRREKALVEGITLPENVVQRVYELAEKMGLKTDTLFN